MLQIGLTERAPTTITAATHCCTSNLFALIVCSQIPSINGQITNRYNQLTANSWRGRCLKAKIWQNLFLKAFEVILCQKVVFQNSGKLQYTGIFAADGAMPLYWRSTVLLIYNLSTSKLGWGLHFTISGGVICVYLLCM